MTLIINYLKNEVLIAEKSSVFGFDPQYMLNVAIFQLTPPYTNYIILDNPFLNDFRRITLLQTFYII